MTPRSISNDLVRDAPSLHRNDTVAHAVERIVESDLPALPVINDRAEVCGIFGEREFMAALFPGYVRELGYAGFVPRKLDDAFEKRAACATEPVAKYMHTEHVDVTEEFSDVEVAETFLHHRVLILPVTRNRHVVGAITRSDFFQRLANPPSRHAVSAATLTPPPVWRRPNTWRAPARLGGWTHGGNRGRL